MPHRILDKLADSLASVDEKTLRQYRVPLTMGDLLIAVLPSCSVCICSQVAWTGSAGDATVLVSGRMALTLLHGPKWFKTLIKTADRRAVDEAFALLLLLGILLVLGLVGTRAFSAVSPAG